MTNQEIAQTMLAEAREMAARGENLYRVRAFRSGAMAVQGAAFAIAETYHPVDELAALLNIGNHLAKAIREFLAQGNWPRERSTARTRRQRRAA